MLPATSSVLPRLRLCPRLRQRRRLSHTSKLVLSHTTASTTTRLRWSMGRRVCLAPAAQSPLFVLTVSLDTSPPSPLSAASLPLPPHTSLSLTQSLTTHLHHHLPPPLSYSPLLASLSSRPVRPTPTIKSQLCRPTWSRPTAGDHQTHLFNQSHTS